MFPAARRDERSNEFHGEVSCHRKGGVPVLVEASSRIVCGTDGQVERVVTTVRDITERHRTEEALRVSEAQYRTIVENAAEGVVVTGTDGITTFANRRMLRCKDGSALWAHFTGLCLFDGAGMHVANMALHTDIPQADIR